MSLLSVIKVIRDTTWLSFWTVFHQNLNMKKGHFVLDPSNSLPVSYRRGHKAKNFERRGPGEIEGLTEKPWEQSGEAGAGWGTARRRGL